MKTDIHSRNGWYGVVVSFISCVVLAVFLVLLRPAVANGLLDDAPYIEALPLPGFLAFQFLLCFTASRRCERMLAQQNSEPPPGKDA